MEHLPSLTPDNSEEVYAESVSDGHLALSRSPSAFLQGSVGHAGSHRLRSGAASMTTSASDSGSVHSTSTHSRERVLGSIFGRRGSVLTNGLRPKSTGSNRSSSMIHDDQSLDAYEMTTMSRIKKKRIVEDIEKRVDRAKADAALVKWRVSTGPLGPTGLGT